ncbi:phage tail protein [Kitasatospora sp. NPDC058478]|uniref:phage tail tube protein n=1 Tax=unclassified Kitasatospora TaxID=2633591 RepID=UPI00365B9887
MVTIDRSSDLTTIGANGGGWVAAPGTTSPTSPIVQPAAPWLPLGAISDDGLKYGFDEDAQAFTPWGFTAPFRTQTTKSLRTFGIKLWETSRTTVKSLMYRVPEASLTPTTGITSYAETAAPQPDRRAFWFVVVDGSTYNGFYVPQGEITDRSDVTFKQDEMAGYEVKITAYPDAAGNTVYHLDKLPATPAYPGS